MKVVITSSHVEKYITKSFVVEAIKYDGTNLEKVEEFAPEVKGQDIPKDVWIIKDGQGRVYASSPENFANGFERLTSNDTI
jgi:hypothetical protein